jgi:hypothetical protein
VRICGTPAGCRRKPPLAAIRKIAACTGTPEASEGVMGETVTRLKRPSAGVNAASCPTRNRCTLLSSAN